MNESAAHALAERFLAAWTSQQVEQVLACYTEDLVYTDPNTRGAVRGREAMRRYLHKLFSTWTMTWSLRELHLHANGDACSVLWHATLQRAAGGPTLSADGMDLVLLRDALVQRNDVYFDRSALAAAETAALKQLLLRGWMTHDAMWFKNALEQHGLAVANQLNRAALRDMTPIEVKRVLRALGLEQVRSFEQLQAFMRGAMELLTGDFFDWSWEWRAPDTLRAEVQRCFAHDGIARLGALDGYECGIFDRIYGWFRALGLQYTVTPDVEHCTMHRDGACARELRFRFPPPPPAAS